MKKRNLLFLLAALLLAAAPLLAATVRLVGYGTTGAVMIFGNE